VNISHEKIAIANFEIDIIRKDIKNMHLAVYPPSGRIRLSAPQNMDIEVIRLFAISKLGWIKKHIKNFKEQKRETPREYISGESHYYQGKRFLLNIIEHKGHNKVEFKGTKKINLYIKTNSTKEQRSKVLMDWYRKSLKNEIPELIEKWENIIGVKANTWGVKQMKTKWGACNTDAKRIWINLELAKKPTISLEYIIVHELIHLLERNHNDKFITYLNQFMPKWRLYRDELNQLPVSHNNWGY